MTNSLTVAADEFQDLQPLHLPPVGTDQLPVLAMQIVIVVWVFVLGACFGSFLNVVIYRLPAGMSLGRPKSRCPRCETPLAARDNVPILGWLALRGKCRYCSLPIAARYPLIEFVCGGIFIALMFGELLTGAANLPWRHPDHFHINPGFWLVWFAKWDLLGLYLFHCSLMIIVLATIMIGYDGHPPQKKLTAFGVILALVAGAFWSELRPLPAYPWPANIADVYWAFSWTAAWLNPTNQYWFGVSLPGCLDGLAGLAVGGLVNCLVGFQVPSLPGSEQLKGGVMRKTRLNDSIAASFLLIGAFLGWQACGMLAVMTLPLLAAISFWPTLKPDDSGASFAGAVFVVGLLGFLFCWRLLDESTWMIGSWGWRIVDFDWRAEWAVTLIGLVCFSLLVRYAHKQTETP